MLPQTGRAEPPRPPFSAPRERLQDPEEIRAGAATEGVLLPSELSELSGAQKEQALAITAWMKERGSQPVPVT